MSIGTLRGCSLFLLHITLIYGQYTSTFSVPIPLFHKSPYFNAWLPANASIYNQGDPPWSMPNGLFVDWMIAVRVDSTAYLLQGENQTHYVTAKTIGAYITSTRTILTMDAGPVRVNLTYLTPIELHDWVLHSLPFVYFSINIWSTDGNPHAIQLYSDVGGTFLSSNRENKMIWSTTTTPKSIYHQARQSIIQSLVENNHMAEDGTQYFATGVTPGVILTWQSATYDIARGNFASTGGLANASDADFRSIRNGWTSMGIALDFGSTTEISKPAIFALGLVRDPVMKYSKDGLDGTQSRSSLWWSRWSNAEQAINAFLMNYPSALSHAIALDVKIASDATNLFSGVGLPSGVATNLIDLIILSVRQTIGSLEFTTLKSPNGELSGPDGWRIFMKDFGSTRRVNPVDSLYASFPAFLYLSPSLAGKLLEPLLEFQVPAVSDNATSLYAAPDLGANWPLVIGNNLDQFYFGVESCGSMLVMALAHARKSGDGSLIATYYDLLRKWANFLVANSLQLNKYTSSLDGVFNATSNVALKGIMGIYAMGQINKALGLDPTYYLNTASSYVQQWQRLALSSDHVMSQYGNTTSWGLLFNLYLPRLLGADIIPQTIYETQASWYASQVPKAPRFGLPFDSSQPNVIKAHWTLFTAASVFNSTNSSARDALISMVHSKPFQISAIVQYYANPSTYFADSGNMTIAGSPAMGAMFAPLALNAPDLTIKFPSSSTSSISAIVGGVLGGVAAFALILVSAYFLFRRRKLRKGTTVEQRPPIDEVRPTENWVPMNEPHASAQSETAASPAELSPPSYTSHPSILLERNPNIQSVAGVMGGDQNSFARNEEPRGEVRLFVQNPLSGADGTSPNTESYALGKDQLLNFAGGSTEVSLR